MLWRALEGFFSYLEALSELCCWFVVRFSNGFHIQLICSVFWVLIFLFLSFCCCSFCISWLLLQFVMIFTIMTTRTKNLLNFSSNLHRSEQWIVFYLRISLSLCDVVAIAYWISLLAEHGSFWSFVVFHWDEKLHS